MSCIILLTQGKEALVDGWNYDWLNQWDWYAHHGRCGGFYAVRSSSRDANGKKTIIFMQDVIGEKIGLIGSIDHIDRNPLNNKEDNLRSVTRSQSTANTGFRSDNTSGFKGVYWDERAQKWRAQIRFQGHGTTLGLFDNPIEAAIMRDNAARRLFKDHATYNFPREGEQGVKDQ